LKLDSMSPETDKRFTIAVWGVLASVTLVCIATVLIGIAPGLGPDKHPPEYLFVSNVAIFLLISVIPALRLANLVRMPWWFNFLLMFDVYLYIISLTCGFYMEPKMAWWGFFGHICSSMSVGAICFLALCIISANSKVHNDYGGRYGVLFVLFMVTVSFGGIWEVMEGYVDLVAGQAYMSYGVFDSLQDLQADVLGAFLMCLIAGLLLRTRTPTDVASSTFIRTKL